MSGTRWGHHAMPNGSYLCNHVNCLNVATVAITGYQDVRGATIHLDLCKSCANHWQARNTDRYDEIDSAPLPRYERVTS